MKKKYYILYINVHNQDISIPILCESLIKIDTSSFGKAHIFRDVITDKIIRPLYGTSSFQKNGVITYNNNDKNNYIRISSKRALSHLKEMNEEKIERHYNILDSIENYKPKKKIIKN